MPLERKLIRFIRDQRFRYKKVHANREPGQEIDPVYKEKFKLLEEIQFEFKSKRKGRPKSDWIEAGWMANYGMLKEHFQKHGSYATLQYKMPLDRKLMRFSRYQRDQYKKVHADLQPGQEIDPVHKEKFKLLEEIQFEFEKKKRVKIAPGWMATYGMLKEYFQKHGGYGTLQYKMPLDSKLMHFIWESRALYKKVHANREPGQEIDPVHKEKFKLLKEIQLEFGSKQRPKWEKKFAEFEEFYAAARALQSSTGTSALQLDQDSEI
eukprot:CAMPEP_0113330634 /NCGR_PEP_ID=MMETSP0010_2-20120614/21808_1 /TAXON_ID=216773 ORGANISM="Corethron hystrix, Strain 308" /NCGR_SAMPLE_ID=MMETSP0010_2 /ASSEMBLY_ACC=CAM_ASM_000155 /LENGTH=264 /DNA_ID=CAMNT_0000193343 /DNA_START=963 /DNA_END=1757 /DNA_ORIENTATION=- /assembly_acc=CAM_ASM_000155